jgi:hypothetical protein
VTTRARSSLPKYKRGQPFRYSETEFAALLAMLGGGLPVSTEFVRWWLEWCATTYLLARDEGSHPIGRAELKAKYDRDEFDLIRAAVVLKSYICRRVVAHYDPALFRKLNSIAADVESAAWCYEQHAPTINRRRANNVDTRRNEYFDQLILLWEGHLKRRLTDGYREGSGPSSAAIEFVAACARPVIGNDKASLDSVRGYIRKYRAMASRSAKSGC